MLPMVLSPSILMSMPCLMIGFVSPVLSRLGCFCACQFSLLMPYTLIMNKCTICFHRELFLAMHPAFVDLFKLIWLAGCLWIWHPILLTIDSNKTYRNCDGACDGSSCLIELNWSLLSCASLCKRWWWMTLPHLQFQTAGTWRLTRWHCCRWDVKLPCSKRAVLD